MSDATLRFVFRPVFRFIPPWTPLPAANSMRDFCFVSTIPSLPYFCFTLVLFLNLILILNQVIHVLIKPMSLVIIYALGFFRI